MIASYSWVAQEQKLFSMILQMTYSEPELAWLPVFQTFPFWKYNNRVVNTNPAALKKISLITMFLIMFTSSYYNASIIWQDLSHRFQTNICLKCLVTILEKYIWSMSPMWSLFRGFTAYCRHTLPPTSIS